MSLTEGRLGHPRALKLQILLVWEIGRSPWGPQHRSPKSRGSRRRKEERRHPLHLQKQLLDKGDTSSILIKYPPVVQADDSVRRQVSSLRGQLRQARRPVAHRVGSAGRRPSTLQQTGISQHRPAPGQWSTPRKSRKEKMSSNTQQLHKVLKGSEPSDTVFSSYSRLFYYLNENFRGLHHTALRSQ